MTASEVATSAAFLRQVNERTVFKRVLELAPTSVTQLVKETGLSKPTVGLTLARLEQVGLVRKVGLRTGAAGRAPQLFGPRPEAGWVVAIDVGLRWVGVLLADLTGTIAGQSRRRSKRSARKLVDQIGDMVDELLAGTDVAPESVLNVVVGSPGVYDKTGHRVRHASNLPGWERPDLVPTLRERLGEHIAFENDVDLAALGEQAYGLGRGVENFVYLHIGSGLGIGAVLGGRLHRGAHGTAGEVAFLPVVTPASGPAALRRGLLETAAAADGLVAAAHRHGLTTATRAEDVLAAAKAEEPAAVRAMADELDHLTTALAAVMTLLDPELVVLGGGVGRHFGDYLVPLRQRLAALLPLPIPAFAVSALGDDATLLGGLASGLRNARERALQRAEPV
ncbi:ROK family transcriptional regulator [Phytohabitans aurantiacus]|jgi:predicted NBD/HSP70 family sugar kinase|uniref:Sugar kinase n=1 Tax=Phytohabitans aurantiacus TaxID=3016789 RepID=A0ABQ5QQX3_9ACTN|nr:ROK family transcriptional regulator [Phytohabitans aurantiacus]GLH97028.1 sugar kinase [Phytohabitans aurantiacus]